MRVRIAAGVAAVEAEHTSVRTVAPVAPAINNPLAVRVEPEVFVAFVAVGRIEAEVFQLVRHVHVAANFQIRELYAVVVCAVRVYRLECDLAVVYVVVNRIAVLGVDCLPLWRVFGLIRAIGCAIVRDHLRHTVHKPNTADVLPDVTAHVSYTVGRAVVVPLNRAGSGQRLATASFVCSAGLFWVAVAFAACSISSRHGVVVPAPEAESHPFVVSDQVPAFALALTEADRFVVADIHSRFHKWERVRNAVDQCVLVLADRVFLNLAASHGVRESQLVRCKNHHNVWAPVFVVDYFVSHGFAPFLYLLRQIGHL